MAGYPYYTQAFTPTFGAYGGNYAPMMQQPQAAQAPSPQATAQTSSGNGVIWVQGETGAKSYLVAPNSTALLMDSESNRFYLKSSDGSGMPQPLRIFEYVEINRNAPNVNTERKTGENEEYALKSDLEALRRDFDAFLGAKSGKKEKKDE